MRLRKVQAKFLLSCWEDSIEQSKRKSLKMLERKSGRLLDCGCSDGRLTVEIADVIRTNDVWGIDIHEERVEKAREKGIKAYCSDLNGNFPFEDDFFDVIFTHQVIEHLPDVDNFVREIRRVLKPGGYALVSTENLSSWHNIFALILGYQDFSHHISTECHIGNPLSPHYLKKVKPGGLASSLKGLTHVKILTFQSLKEIFVIHGFAVEKIVGAGYPPTKGRISSMLSCLDPSHSYFIIVKARKRKHVEDSIQY